MDDLFSLYEYGQQDVMEPEMDSFELPPEEMDYSNFPIQPPEESLEPAPDSIDYEGTSIDPSTHDDSYVEDYLAEEAHEHSIQEYLDDILDAAANDYVQQNSDGFGTVEDLRDKLKNEGYETAAGTILGGAEKEKSDTKDADSAEKSANDDTDDEKRKEYREKMEEAHAKVEGSGVDWKHRRDTFVEIDRFKETYYAYKAGVSIDNKEIGVSDVIASFSKMTHTNILETLVLRLIDKIEDKIEEKNREDAQESKVDNSETEKDVFNKDDSIVEKDSSDIIKPDADKPEDTDKTQEKDTDKDQLNDVGRHDRETDGDKADKDSERADERAFEQVEANIGESKDSIEVMEGTDAKAFVENDLVQETDIMELSDNTVDQSEDGAEDISEKDLDAPESDSDEIEHEETKQDVDWMPPDSVENDTEDPENTADIEREPESESEYEDFIVDDDVVEDAVSDIEETAEEAVEKSESDNEEDDDEEKSDLESAEGQEDDDEDDITEFFSDAGYPEFEDDIDMLNSVFHDSPDSNNEKLNDIYEALNEISDYYNMPLDDVLEGFRDTWTMDGVDVDMLMEQILDIDAEAAEMADIEADPSIIFGDDEYLFDTLNGIYDVNTGEFTDALSNPEVIGQIETDVHNDVESSCDITLSDVEVYEPEFNTDVEIPDSDVIGIDDDYGDVDLDFDPIGVEDIPADFGAGMEEVAGVEEGMEAEEILAALL